MSPPDVVIPVRPGERNEELRYALRSIAAHLPHGTVWLAGHCPTWVTGVEHIPTKQHSSKYENSTRNLLTACRRSEVSEDFVLWNDDMFLLEPLGRIPVLHRGPVRDVLEYYRTKSSKHYTHGMRVTTAILQTLGRDDPLSYELHVPMNMRKEGLIEAMAYARTADMPRTRAIHKRTLYGNYWEVGGEQVPDVKIHHMDQRWNPAGETFVSTNDKTFKTHTASLYVHVLFPEPGPYEREGA